MDRKTEAQKMDRKIKAQHMDRKMEAQAPCLRFPWKWRHDRTRNTNTKFAVSFVQGCRRVCKLISGGFRAPRLGSGVQGVQAHLCRTFPKHVLYRPLAHS